MFKRFINKQLETLGASAATHSSGSSEPLRQVRTLEEARRAIEVMGWCGNLGPTPAHLATLRKACQAMRTQGMALEPNLLGRAACSLVLDRREAGRAAAAFAAEDGDFLALARDGDGARDRGAFADAQYRYWQALQLHPLHPGYLVQYAHCLKERGLYPDAVVNYLDAYLHGAPRSDVEEHALFVAGHVTPSHRLKALFESDGAASADARPLAVPASSQDIVALSRLLLGRPPEIGDIAMLMCSQPDRAAVLSSLMGRADFARTHRLCLGYLADTAWGTA